MHNPWTHEFIKTLLLIGTCTIAGLLAEQTLAGFAIGLLISLAALHYRLYSFNCWYNGNKLEKHPVDAGIVESFYHRAQHLQTQQNQQKKHLEQIIKRFQESARAIPDAVIILNSRNELMWTNKAARKLIGLKRKKDVGQAISNLIRHPEFISYLEREKFKYPIEFALPKNSNIQLRARIIPYGRDSRLLIIRDITQLHNLERMRREFIASASHELRTPLTVITGYLEAMEGSVADETREIIRTMFKQAQRMESIINNMLLLARLESMQNHKEKGRKPVMVNQLINNIYEDADAISGGEHQFKLDVSAHINVLGIENELHSAFSNLVQNAVRYTPAGSHITITWKENKQGAVFIVEDNGPGIPAHHLSRLTERFYRVDTGRSRDKGGTGLGLSIVEQIMQHHEGRLLITSKPNQSTRFACEFPAHLVLNQQSPLLKVVV
jgi:two-component system phosphate regulon sensor histidine kinase PhoR